MINLGLCQGLVLRLSLGFRLGLLLGLRLGLERFSVKIRGRVLVRAKVSIMARLLLEIGQG
jgi:hypothetical protein